MTTTRRSILAITLASGLLLAAAAPAMAGDAAKPLRAPYGDWQRTVKGIDQTITFTKDGKVYGDAGCNRFTGSYTRTGDQLAIGPLATTMMYCEGKMDAEQAMLTSLGAATTYIATKKSITLTGDAGTLRFSKA